MKEVVRSDEEIQGMIEAIEHELERLPERDIFGGSNAESKAEMKGDLRELQDYLSHRTLPFDKWNNVRLWLIGHKASDLQDHLED